MQAPDPYFTKRELTFNGYIWGAGSKKIYLTHGWSSKATDFTEIITALKELDDVQIIAFDALGNGSSEGELSNLMLYAKPLETIINIYGMPKILIGHSLGAMANIVALKEFQQQPELLISITPVVELEQNFKGMMNYAEVSPENQAIWFKSFNDYYKVPVSYFDMKSLYAQSASTKQIVFYDQNDELLPYAQLTEFLRQQPQIIAEEFNGAGHYKILKERALINVIKEAITTI
jgi:pimeloyl-ACP methyl ester carboxylesterase